MQDFATIHSIGCGLQCRKRIWIATRWSGRVEQNEQRSFAILKWILSRIKRNMDRLCVPSGSGSYILSCSHISDCVIYHNIHLSYSIMFSNFLTDEPNIHNIALEQFEMIHHSHPSNKCIQNYTNVCNSSSSRPLYPSQPCAAFGCLSGWYFKANLR